MGDSQRSLMQKRQMTSNSGMPLFLRSGKNEGMFYASPSSSTQHIVDSTKGFTEEGKRLVRKVDFDVEDDMLGDIGSDKNYRVDENNPKLYTFSPPLSALGPSDRSYTSNSTIGFEDEDDCSYLDGAETRISDKYSTPNELDKSQKLINARREMAAEQIYWPFRRHYEINGNRRL